MSEDNDQTFTPNTDGAPYRILQYWMLMFYTEQKDTKQDGVISDLCSKQLEKTNLKQF